MARNSKVVYHFGLFEVNDPFHFTHNTDTQKHKNTSTPKVLKMVSNSSRPMKVSNEVESQVSSSVKNRYGESSSKITQSCKAQKFVANKRTGQTGFKQEAKSTYKTKHVDKQQGITTEYKTQLKVTKSVYPNKGRTNSTSNKRINYY